MRKALFVVMAVMLVSTPSWAQMMKKPPAAKPAAAAAPVAKAYAAPAAPAKVADATAIGTIVTVSATDIVIKDANGKDWAFKLSSGQAAGVKVGDMVKLAYNSSKAVTAIAVAKK